MHISHTAVKTDSRIIALLGPTNTGKTHYAMEQMLSHASGCIGFPLRLLARENYDRACQSVGVSHCALVTGEEKIIPPRARFYFCTVESMPLDQSFDFIGIDEIQLCADPDRGHIFTDRLLHARGLETTMFMGADTIKPLLGSLVPRVEMVERPRLSTLTYTGFKKLTRLPKRTAIVAFSVDDVYAIADLIRRQKGGTAIVMGALSPRTRNAQVELYQSGAVDYMVATDAIGMGLNMDINHIALAATRKFDGERLRPLSTAELAQIAGRAGRYKKDGTFGVTGNIGSLEGEITDAIEKHSFETLKNLYWRNSYFDFHSPKALLKSLERSSGLSALQKGRPADDYLTLTKMIERDDVMVRAEGEDSVRLLWEVCQIPDFRKTMTENHEDLVAEIYTHLHAGGVLPEEWMETHIARLDSVEGDVDTLMARIAHVRTWTYVTHRKDWLSDPSHWQGRTLGIEDRLSDALHEALTRRFVDKRSAVLMARMEEGGTLLAGIKKDGDVVVEGQSVGRLSGFRFYPDQTSGREELKAVMTAARQALRPEIGRRLSMILKAEDKQFKLADDGHVLWQQDITNPLPGDPVARILKGDAILKPRIVVLESPFLEGTDRNEVEKKLHDWLERHIHFTLEPLFRLTSGDDLTAQARGIAFQVQEALGIIPRADVEELIAALDENGRKALRARKLRMGPLLIFLPDLNKPAAVKMRAMLLTLWQDKPLPAVVPKDGIVSYSITGQEIDEAYFRAIGYPVYGPRAIRVDMLDRVVCAVYDNAKDGKFQAQHTMAEWLGSNILDLYAVLTAMGHTLIHDPAADKAKEESVESAVESPANDAPAAEVPPPEVPAVKAKPVLATFRLKRGKANEASKPRPPRPDKKPEQTTYKKEHKADKPRDKKPHKHKSRDQDKHGKKEEREDRMYSAPAKEIADSPFAILQQLKQGK